MFTRAVCAVQEVGLGRGEREAGEQKDGMSEEGKTWLEVNWAEGMR